MTALCTSHARQAREWEDYQHGQPYTGTVHYAASLDRRARLAVETRAARAQERAATIRQQLGLIATACAAQRGCAS